MKELDQQIANTIRRYPTLYPCRTSVLHNWFCVGGSGYEWVNGRLVSGEEDKPLLSREQTIEKATDWLVARIEKNKRIGEYSPEMQAHNTYDLRFEQDMVGRRYDMADTLALMPWPRPSRSRRDHYTDIAPERIYHLSEYCALSRVPDGVHPDFLSAAREMILTIFESQPWQYEERFEMTQEDLHTAHHETLQMADRIAQELARRFGPSKKPNSLAEFQLANKRREEMLKEVLRSRKDTSPAHSEPSIPNSPSDVFQPEDECQSPIGCARAG